MIEGKLLNLCALSCLHNRDTNLSYDNGGGKGGMYTKALGTELFGAVL